MELCLDALSVPQMIIYHSLELMINIITLQWVLAP